jgi:hypothetical protein
VALLAPRTQWLQLGIPTDQRRSNGTIGETVMNEEDEAFEQLALRQGQWDYSGQNTSGWRKKQVAHMDVHSHPAEFVHLHRNDTIEEIAQHLETKFTGPFGRDTVQSFVAYIRGMKR